MDTGAALARMAKLLEPGGVLVVVGLARGLSPADLLLTVPAVAGSRVHRATRAEVIAWAAAQEWCTGDVATWGPATAAGSSG
jgi:hypothetical protein